MTPPQHPSGETILKASAKRTITLCHDDAGAARVTKRFHGPGLGGLGWIGAPGDWRRARGERKAMDRARAAGLPVPEAYGVTRTPDHGWELAMEAIPGARPLTEVLEDAWATPESPHRHLARLAARLGALLRSAEAAQFVHADPHPANVLVDPQGDLWIVDMARSRTGASPARVAHSITRALSRTRELAPRTFRRRIALAWLGPRATAAWTRSIETEATLLRVGELRNRVSVWRRNSSATVIRTGHGGLERAVWVRERLGSPPVGWTTRRESGTKAEVGAIWETLVRAKLHLLPGCEPRALTLAAPFSVDFDVPAEPRPPSEEAAHATHRLLAARGLEVRSRRPGIDALLAGADGIARISPFASIALRRACGERP